MSGGNLSAVENILCNKLTRKMVSITGRASSFLEFLCTLIERKRRRGRQNNNYRAIKLPKVI